MYMELCATYLLGVFDPGACCPGIGELAVHVMGRFCGRSCFTAPVPATLEVLFVDGKDEEAMVAFPTVSSSDVPVLHLH